MRERAISSAVIAAVVVAVFLLGQPWLTIGIAALAALAARETFRMLPASGFPVEPLPGVVLPPLLVLALGFDILDSGWIALYVALVLVVLAIDGLRRPAVRDGFLAWLGGSFGALYPALLAFMAGILTVAPTIPGDAVLADVFSPGQTWLLVLVLTVWSFDTFAYLAGRTFKRGRFLNHISPSKTWSGVIGGTVAAIVVGGVLAMAAGQWLPGGLVMGLLVAVTGQAGDVAESMLKRTAGVKDSGALIPGHGGILDRTDSFLFAAPVVYGYLLVVTTL